MWERRQTAQEIDYEVALKGLRFGLRTARTECTKDAVDIIPHSANRSDLFCPGDADPDLDHAFTLRNPSNQGIHLPIRVHGIRGLRICDSSVFPSQVSGHPAVIAVAVAEKTTDMLKGAGCS